MPLAVNLFIGLLTVLVWVYNIVTFPIYFLVQHPWTVWKINTRKKAFFMEPRDPTSPLIKIPPPKPVRLGASTLDEMFLNVVKKNPDKPGFGTRSVLGEEMEQTPDGKSMKKSSLGEYTWLTYNEADKKITLISKGLLRLGLKPKQCVTIYAETRAEWILTALACLRIRVTVVTIYATLGEEGVVHGLQETGSEFVVASVDLLPRIIKNADKVSHVRQVIYMEGVNPPDLSKAPDTIMFIRFHDLVVMGQSSMKDLDPSCKPKNEDTAMIMYTSGSTGTPKGVVFQHKQILATINEILNFGFEPEAGMYAAYLPLAHIFEFCMEVCLIALGIPMGYGSPFTLTASSPGLKKGCLGDADLLKPTMIAAVPLILDKIRKGVENAIGGKGALMKAVLNYSVSYKSYWYKRGFGTPILDRLLFSKTKMALGGRCQFIISGGAPLSPDTQDFIQATLCVEIIQGYGMTETTSLGATCLMHDRTTDHVGPPPIFGRVKLVDWAEGKYFTSDKPKPRGELMVGGDSVAQEYYKKPDLTKESFIGPDENGIRWFITGDIVEVQPMGNIKIIDRKKDLVKLQFGEYISLGKVESILKTCGLVENICVFGNSYQNFLVALVTPSKIQLVELAKGLGKNADKMPWNQLCSDPDVITAASKVIIEHGLKGNLLKIEVPSFYKLCHEDWLPDTGLVTAALKVKRKSILEFYKKDLDNLYKQGPTTQGAEPV